MSVVKKLVNSAFCKWGTCIAGLALIVTAVTANSACCIPFYEEEEPQGLEKFKALKK